MTPRVLAARYIGFATVATVANLGSQRLTLAATRDTPMTANYWNYCAAVLIGTVVGLVVKFILDKRWIFYDKTKGVDAQSKQLFLYVMMGGVTTAIFWGAESLCWLVWHTQVAREIGATFGLTIGYVVKYRLDRRFVFVNDGEVVRSVTW